MTELTTYLLIHGVTTVGSVLIFLIRNEHRITKLEVSHNHLKTSHDVLTVHGTIPHGK